MFKNGFILGKYYIEENIGRIIKIFSFLHKSFSFKSSRRERLTPVLSHHRTYGSVYGGSIKIIDASFHNELQDFPTLGFSNRSYQGFCVILDYLKYANNSSEYFPIHTLAIVVRQVE